LMNTDWALDVRNSVVLDTTMLQEVLEGTSYIDAGVVSARLMQLVKEYYDSHPNGSICLMSPLFFQRGINQGRVEEFFLTNYANSETIIVPILCGQHFTLAIQNVKRNAKINSVRSSYYDSFMSTPSEAVKEKLKHIAHFLHPGCRHYFADDSKSADQQIDGVNCGAFVTKNVELFLTEGAVRKTEMSGFDKRYELLRILAPLIDFDVPARENTGWELEMEVDQEDGGSNEKVLRSKKLKIKALLEKELKRFSKQLERETMDPEERKHITHASVKKRALLWLLK